MSDQTLQPQYLSGGGGKEYDWMQDHIFVKLTSAGTGGLCTLIQDNLKPGFNLGLHLHREHTEIFYILDGEVEFTLGDEIFAASASTVIYVPPGTPHAAKSDKSSRMLMFYIPGGFDEFLAELSRLTPDQLNDQALMATINEKYDIITL